MKRFSFYLNIIFIAILSLIIIKEKYLSRLKQKLFPDNSLAYYNNRPAYKEELARYDVYGKQAPIVMLGTSLSQDIDWNELLNRGDIVNRSYGGDIIEVMQSRLPYILAVHPKICFIEGGINDIDTNISPDKSLAQLSALIDSLKRNSIIPVLTAITAVTNTAHKHVERNAAIAAFNTALVSLAKEKNIDIINNNTRLAPEGFLRDEYAKADGLHFQPATYLIWKEAVQVILMKNKL
jgi:lysophospholipase L1-like esterase